MTEFWKIILSSFLGAFLAIIGGYILFKIQENRKLDNAKASMYLELSIISKLLKETDEELKRNEGFGTVQVMINKIYQKPSDFETFKSIFAQLPKSDFESIGELYSKLIEFEEVRSYLIERKENGIELSELIDKKALTSNEKTTVQFMRIYEAYFRNLDALINEIEKVKKVIK